MYPAYLSSSSREAQTGMPCRRCAAPLKAVRAWRSVVLRCKACAAEYAITEYAMEMDEALEEFLGRMLCDRV